MDRRKKVRIHEGIFIVAAWVILMNLYSWFTMANFEIFVNAADLSNIIRNNVITNYMYSGYQYIESTLFGVLFGFAFAVLNHYSYPSIFKKHSFGYVILFQSIFYIVSIVLSGILIYFIMSAIGIIPDQYLNPESFKLITFEAILALGIFILSTIILINFILQVNRKFGPGNLKDMILGKYSTPLEEQRIFMFLDLNDSTTHAERLGHLKYSELIQNCYRDLTNVVLKYDADVYQYVGDEVVLSWKISKGLYRTNCITIFFAYENVLNRREEFYKAKFGFVPQFKAGVDMGTVTGTEIGEIKREIAFHGDVLNTASRIQHMCRKLNQKLIVSEKVANHISLGNRFSKKSIGEINLKGKKSVTTLYSISFNKQ